MDVFTVRPAAEAPPASVWAEYGSELAGLLRQVAAGQANDAQGELAFGWPWPCRTARAPETCCP